MKLKVSLDPKSVQEAIKALKKAKAQLPKMMNEFLTECCNRIIELANQNLEWVEIGSAVKEKIRLSWDVLVTDGTAVITNLFQKAVYVEFGTGVVGEQSPHANALSAGYDYNRESPYKDEQGRWTFYTDYEDLDIPMSALNDITVFRKNNASRMQVRTSGAPATMFVYNAIMRFKSEEHAKEIWERIKAKYWG